MSIINFKDIDCNKSIEKENKKINFNGSEIQIVNYLSTKDKYDLIMITLQKSFEKGIYNPFKIDIYFDLNIIYLYTNIVFSVEDRADEASLYDTLKRSGLIDLIKENIDDLELKYLKQCIYNLIENINKYGSTFGAAINNFIEQLPQNMEKAKEIIGDFDPSKYQILLNFANQLNKSNTLS